VRKNFDAVASALEFLPFTTLLRKIWTIRRAG
jgi:hypothetical protein